MGEVRPKSGQKDLIASATIDVIRTRIATPQLISRPRNRRFYRTVKRFGSRVVLVIGLYAALADLGWAPPPPRLFPSLGADPPIQHRQMKPQTQKLNARPWDQLSYSGPRSEDSALGIEDVAHDRGGSRDPLSPSLGSRSKVGTSFDRAP